MRIDRDDDLARHRLTGLRESRHENSSRTSTGVTDEEGKPTSGSADLS
jgi:hypothetical protein